MLLEKGPNWVLLVLAYQEKKKMNQSEKTESARKSGASLVDFLTSSLPRLDSPAWVSTCMFVFTTQQLLPSLTICSFALPIPFLNFQLWWEKKISTQWLRYFSSFPSHFLMGTQQGLYSSLIVSDYKILVFSRRPSLHLHTCIHRLSFTVLTSSAMHCPLSLHVHIAITKASLYVSSLGLLSPTFLKTNITFLGFGCDVFPLLLIHSFLSLSFPYLSFSHLVNCQTQLPFCEKASRTKKWIKDDFCLEGDI